MNKDIEIKNLDQLLLQYKDNVKICNLIHELQTKILNNNNRVTTTRNYKIIINELYNEILKKI